MEKEPHMHYFVLWSPKNFHECKTSQEADEFARDLIARGEHGVGVLVTSESKPFKVGAP
jgi:hypothetical protein